MTNVDERPPITCARVCSCLDIDECGIMHGVCGDGECQNVPGSFACKCKEGYETSRLTQVCTGNCTICLSLVAAISRAVFSFFFFVFVLSFSY